MKDKTKDRLNFGLGLMTGILIGYYLSSEEGRKLRSLALQRLDELSEEMGEKVQEQIGLLTEGVESAFLKGRSYVDEVSDTVKGEMDRSTDSAEDVISSARNSFLRGMERARRRIEGEGKPDTQSDS